MPRRRQTLLFSATLPPAIRNLADQWLTDPRGRARRTRRGHDRRPFANRCSLSTRSRSCNCSPIGCARRSWTRTLVFTRTKHGADKIAKSLVKAGIEADAFHGNKSQSARQRVLLRFKAPRPLVLVATDIAARGLDIDHVSHVVNFDLPADADSYVHRIGRTGRAGATGVAVSFCDQGERSSLQAIQRLTRQTLAVEERPAGMPAAPANGSASAQSMAPGRPAASASSRPGYAKRFSGQRRGASVRRRKSL